MCIFLYIGDSSFSFLFSRIFKVISMYRLCQDIWCFTIQYFFPYISCLGDMVFIYIGYFLIQKPFSFCILPKLSVLPIYSEYHPFCNVFPIYRITPFLFLRLCPEFVYFPINAFSSYIYIGNRHFFFLSSPQRVFLYIGSIHFLYTLPQYFLYIFFCTLPRFLIYIAISLQGVSYISFLFFVLPRLIAISLYIYIVNFCILPRLIYSIRDITSLFLYFAQIQGCFYLDSCRRYFSIYSKNTISFLYLAKVVSIFSYIGIFPIYKTIWTLFSFLSLPRLVPYIEIQYIFYIYKYFPYSVFCIYIG